MAVPPRRAIETMNIVILTQYPDSYSTRRIVEAARAQGHEAEVLNLSLIHI